MLPSRAVIARGLCEAALVLASWAAGACALTGLVIVRTREAVFTFRIPRRVLVLANGTVLAADDKPGHVAVGPRRAVVARGSRISRLRGGVLASWACQAVSRCTFFAAAG